MSRFVLGNCIDVMTRIPDNAIDFILTDPPYLVGFRDRSGRTIAGDKTDEWLQPACNEMYRVLKKDALMVSFYGWNRVDRFMAAWKNAGFSVVGHLVFTKNYTSKAAYVGYRHECAYILAKGRPRLPQNPLPDVLGWKYSGNRHHPTEKPVMDELIAKAWRFVRERFRSYQTELKSRGIKRARARRDANRERQDIVTLVKRQLTREISEGRFSACREAVKREVERRVKERMILSRNRNYSRLATASP
ncbi:DNA methyltransferase [Escherichia coli]|uniref:DNA methyltransferase n=1 Tax=Escherichia coli TaxID=562 RepID=UPI001C602E1C|nr:DNA methyltransferase [Escherichia coli]MCL7192680.1 DNA methyltransferase [Escherichia coli]MCL7211717.1 DNA methyltransferase [Escherichia coli]MCL7219107.1 DNA methyltransferase [Escherichia coli]MCL7332892.1 DNA methyltransferase [Escherichia coli]MCL7363677.1 DNA methyltransferase [Escherichia coli]